MTVWLLPRNLHSLGLGPNALVSVVLIDRAVVLCPDQDAEVWENILADFPFRLVGGPDGPSEEPKLP